MNDKRYTGDGLLDKLTRGPYVANPNYNPKTKRGRVQSPTLIDTTPGDINGGIFSNVADKIDRISYSANTLGRDIEEVREDMKNGITLSPYNSEEDLNKARAEAQSGFEQFGNFLAQSIGGEVILGGLEGFGNIIDGIVNTFTGDNYNVNPYTQFMHEAKENFNKKFEIYRENPNEDWDMSDSGWWFQNAVSIFSTASLMLPAAGWAKGLSMLGKVSGASRAFGSASKFISKGLARAAKNVKNGSRYSALKNIAAKQNRIERTINDAAYYGSMAVLNRAGEGFMEARQVHDDVYKNSLENLNNMPDEEFEKFLQNNKEFINEDGSVWSKEDIAKEIARKSANKTFYNDYWMLLMDIPQFKALGKLWGNVGKRASTAAERIAAKNQIKRFAGLDEDKLIANNILNRTKERLSYALKNPAKSWTALELGEGFEEIYQGIQTEKGMEAASKYFDPTMTARTLESYLSDGSIWEQGFWGTLGGILFPVIGSGVRTAGRKIQGAYNKKHMTAEDYERWKRSEDKIAIEQINNINAEAQNFLQNVEKINQGVNPFTTKVDANTGLEIIENGHIVEESVSESEKDKLIEKAVDDFIKNVSLTSVDNGTFDLMKEILGSKEFDDYIKKNGGEVTGSDKALSQQIISRMDEIGDLYTNTLKDVYDLSDSVNPFVSIAVARNITKNKLRKQDYENELAIIDDKIAEQNTENLDISNNLERARYFAVRRHLNSLDKQLAELEQEYNDKKIGRSAYEQKTKEINRAKKELIGYYTENTTSGFIDSVRKAFEKEFDDEQIINEFNLFVAKYDASVDENANSVIDLPVSIQESIYDRVDTEIKRAYTTSQIPLSKEDYQNIYNEFSQTMDKLAINRVNDNIESVKNYLRNAKDFEDAVEEVLAENTKSKKVNEALNYLRYGYTHELLGETVSMNDMLRNTQIEAMIEELRKERQGADRRNEKAEEVGIEIPEDNLQEETTEDNQEQTSDMSSPSTGEETIADATDTAETDSSINIADTANQTDTVSPDGIDREERIDVDENVDGIVRAEPDVQADNSLPVEENPLDTGLTDKEKAESAELAQTYETDDLKADLDARKYVMQVGFKESGRIDNITEALKNNDTSKRDAFIKEIEDFLIKQGYSPAMAAFTAKKAFSSTVANFAMLNSKSAFGRLASQMALGFDETGANKYSITELLDGKGIDEVTENFLKEYIKLVGGAKVGQDKYLINLQSLFDFILNNENIDKITASNIYNNLSSYIAKHDGSKFVFSGFNFMNNNLSAKEFFDRLNENKSQIFSAKEKVHISPVEIKQRSRYYNRALVEAHNGAKTYVKPQYTRERNDDEELYFEQQHTRDEIDDKEHLSNLSVYVDIKINGKNTPIKIGILRAVDFNETLDVIEPMSHNSGFKNAIRINATGEITLDCDDLFMGLINLDNDNFAALYDELSDYAFNLQDLIIKYRQNKLSKEDYNKAVKKLMTKERAKRILENPEIKNILDKEIYKFYNKDASDIEKAETLANAISKILFYGNSFDSADANNSIINDMALDTTTMIDRYNTWKSKIYDNYKYTYELQKNIEDENTAIDISINVAYVTTLNTIEDKKDYVDISDAGFDIDKNTDGQHTPLVIVNKNRHLVDEYGNDYGLPDARIGDYSMGFLVHNEDGVTFVAYCNEEKELTKTELAKHIQDELADIIKQQLANTNDETHFDKFLELKERLVELFGPGGLFKFGNIRVEAADDNSWITIYEDNGVRQDGKRNRKNLLTFYLKNANNVTNSNAISVYNNRLGVQVSTNDLNKSGETSVKNGRVKVDPKEVRTNLNEVLKRILSSVKLNRSLSAVTGKTNAGGTPRIFRRENGKFIVTLGGKQYVYENYGDFVLKNNGYTTNVKKQDGSFVQRHLNPNRVTINTKVRDTSDDVAPSVAVTDLLFDGKKAKRKTVKANEVLEAAGVPQDKIDVLLGTNSGMPIINKNIYVDDSENNDANAYYNETDKRIYVTLKGATSMNGNPINAVRLVLHENLHRLFNSNRYYSDTQRNRIIEELKEVYNYTIDKLNNDLNSGQINKNTYNAIINVFNKATSYGNDQTNMEEFLMECLTQPLIVNYLNDTEYKEEAIIDGIPQKKKSIFQKIMDILLKLLGINNTIKNNSILAREYIILSKTANKTSDSSNGFRPNNTASTETDNNSRITSPVEGEPIQEANPVLDKTKSKIDEIRSDFEKRIVRSPNFKEDHTYYIDGKPVDYSVTQKIHGKQDVGAWGVPASTLGNTADETARVFFDNDGTIPDNYNIPNVTKEEDTGLGARDDNSDLALKGEIQKIKDYLDKRFGKNKYGVITQEFPIGGRIIVDGEEKTIAGTMDMIVYTDNGDIYIFDFKTKRIGSSDGNLSEETLAGYKQQINIYRQLIEENYPELKGKVKLGGLIKMNVDYPAPSDNVKYRVHPNIENQLQVDTGNGFVNIQDSEIDYSAPFFASDLDNSDTIIPAEIKDYTDKIMALSDIEESSDIDKTKDTVISGENMIQTESIEDLDFDDDDFYDDAGDGVEDMIDYAKTELAEVDGKTSVEIYAPPIADGDSNNEFGIRVVNDINEFVDSFPTQYRPKIRSILAENELNYTCR